MLKIVLAGSVKSSLETLKSLVKHEMNVIGVLGYEPSNITNISGYVSMKAFCDEHTIPYYAFVKINSEQIFHTLKELQPDILFVVGLSQLVSENILSVAKLGNIGFHPTALPAGRGRAPIAWLILEEKVGAANFFLMGKGTDDGPIFIQQKFSVEETDTAASIQTKILKSLSESLDSWLPSLKKDEWIFTSQDEGKASYYGKRNPEDGIINWNSSSEKIDKLIRASSKPYPGAYTFQGTNKILIWHSKIEKEIKIKGVIGRVLLVRNNEFLVQCGTNLLWLTDITDESFNSVTLKVGEKLGYYPELEIYNLKKEIQLIKEWIQKKIS